MWTLLLCAGVSARAFAYDEAPLCAAPRPYDDTFEPLADDAELSCMPGMGMGASEAEWTAPIDAAQAREALTRANTLVAEGRADDALLSLRVVEHAMPRIADRIALRRAELLLALDRPADACDAYAVAQKSPERNVAAQARVAMVRCLLAAGRREGEAELLKITRRYPYLGERSELRLGLGRAREAWNDKKGAAAIYRELDLHEPHTPEAQSAREALARLQAAGIVVRPYTTLEQLERAERLLRSGPIEMAKQAVAALLESALPAPLLARAHLLAARIARIEGRFDAVAEQTALAMKSGASYADAQRLLPRGAAAVADVDPSVRATEGEARWKRLLGGRTLAKVPGAQLRGLLDVALQYQLRERATEVLATMQARPLLQPALRFEAAILAAGLASDQAVADLLLGVEHAPAYALSARYHRARALERMGRFDEAEAGYLRVILEDDSGPRYYAMWADLRLWSMQSERRQSCVPEGVAGVQDAGSDSVKDAVAEVLAALPNGAAEDESEGESDLADKAVDDADTAAKSGAASVYVESAESLAATAERTARAERRERLVATLAPVATAHAAAFPWFARAVDLIELELFADAADEIAEGYVAWRDARGEMRLRSGLEAVLTGSAPERHVVDNALGRLRRELPADARAVVASVADELGDPGVSLRFRKVLGEARPRAYPEAVEAAAAKYGLDPNLLFAVMRVESIYHRQIVSHAGAVGLMQIMPRTGMLIARKLGVERFDVSDLLDPRTNVEFAAWYLSSLLQRFDGRLPLAIAAYNGGPHNVRIWMREHQPEMPLDAFLERIPFTETHRYVRRVLTHYAAYRAQQRLPMARLDVTLPDARPDAMAF